MVELGVPPSGNDGIDCVIIETPANTHRKCHPSLLAMLLRLQVVDRGGGGVSHLKRSRICSMEADLLVISSCALSSRHFMGPELSVRWHRVTAAALVPGPHLTSHRKRGRPENRPTHDCHAKDGIYLWGTCSWRCSASSIWSLACDFFA